MDTPRRPAVSACLALVACMACATGSLPPHPDAIRFPPLHFQVPDGASMRVELSNGVPVYLVEDHQLPLVSLVLVFRAGRALEPEGREGLATLTADTWVAGGAAAQGGREIENRLEELAADLSLTMGDELATVQLDVLTEGFAAALELVAELVASPRFDEPRVEVARQALLHRLRGRNDDSATIEELEWERLVHGPDSTHGRHPTEASVAAITAADCRGFLTSLLRAGNLAVGVAGDIDRSLATESLERTVGALPPLQRALPEPLQPEHDPTPGVYLVHRPGMEQARVRLGHIGVRLDHPDELALRALNDLLGGGAFTSRITRRIRSDEGLAYSSSSHMTFGFTIPGTFSVDFQTKSSNSARAIEIALEEIADLRSNGPSEEELATTRAALTATLLRRFETAERSATTLATDELMGRPEGYWARLGERLAALTPEGIRRVAERHLRPQDLVMLVVGDAEAVLAGHPDHATGLSDFGEIRSLPLRDPLTLQPLQP